MQMTLTIDIATEADIPELCILLDSLFTQEAEFTPNHAAQVRGLSMIIQNPSVGHILLARHAGRAVGMVNLLYTVSTALGERVVLLEDMVVTAAERGRGTGSLLLQTAIDFAKQQGCKRITLLTDKDNAAAQNFYSKQGFTLSSMVPLRLSLE